MKTLLGTEVPLTARAVFYVCFYHQDKVELNVIKEVISDSQNTGLELYSETRNPESQLALGRTNEELLNELTQLHKNMTNKKWVKDLANYL